MKTFLAILFLAAIANVQAQNRIKPGWFFQIGTAPAVAVSVTDPSVPTAAPTCTAACCKTECADVTNTNCMAGPPPMCLDPAAVVGAIAATACFAMSQTCPMSVMGSCPPGSCQTKMCAATTCPP